MTLLLGHVFYYYSVSAFLRINVFKKLHDDESNLAKDEIASAVHLTPRLYSLDGSIEQTVWLQSAIACFGWVVVVQCLPP